MHEWGSPEAVKLSDVICSHYRNDSNVFLYRLKRLFIKKISTTSHVLVYWVALFPHSKNVPGSNLSWVRLVTSLHVLLVHAGVVSGFLPQSKNKPVGLIGGTKLAPSVYGCLSLWWPRDGLLACPGCILPLARSQLGQGGSMKRMKQLWKMDE